MQMEEIRESIMECSDARVKAISELLAGIKAIKLYAWEEPWVKRISSLREKELAQIKREAMLNIIGSLLWLAVRYFIPCIQPCNVQRSEHTLDFPIPVVALHSVGFWCQTIQEKNGSSCCRH